MAESNLRELDWLPQYESGCQDLVEDFYVPALSRAARYDRKAGFFSSSALAVAATGVARLLARGGRMRLLVGVSLSPQDLEALAEGHRRREEVIEAALERRWTPPAGFLAQQRHAALAEMVARGCLEIRVVAALGSDGAPLPAGSAEAMFHIKTGVFTDAEGQQVAFSGSVNETEAGWERNVENFHVYCSWRADAGHAQAEVQAFERMWRGEHPGALTLSFPAALRERLLEQRAAEPPELDPLESEAQRRRRLAQEREQWLFQFLRDAPRLHNGPTLVEEFSAIRPWPHQRRVYQGVCRSYPDGRYLLCDEVGLGKTIEAGLALRALLLPGRARRVLLLVPRSLIRQWQEELREKFNLWAWWYDGREFVSPLGERQPPAEGNPWEAPYPLIIASVHLAKRKERREALLGARPWDLVLVDEAHHARRRWGPGAHRRPNHMLRLLEELRERTRGLLLMTATPMQVDVRELWDLLRLVGMQGRWAEGWGDEFSRYFYALCAAAPDREQARLLVELVQEYFATGGEPAPELREAFCRRPGGFVRWSKLTSRLSPADPNLIREAWSEPGGAELLQRFFSEHTPVRRFAYRYTRQALRRYQAQGLFSAVIPRREVEDCFLDLGEARPLYERIEDYLGQQYRQAFDENRKGRGYLMTIYRQRLTSSPWAISETLRRHRERLLTTLAGTEQRDLREELEGLVEEDLLEAGLEEDADELFEQESVLDPAALVEEIRYLEDFLHELGDLGADPKLRQLLSDLQDLRAAHPRAVIFTQYTDTMDLLREELAEVYGAQVACFSGRGGEVYRPEHHRWATTSKDDIKAGFFDGRYWILVCTEAASEGLNLQASDLLINYDMPWNPMRVEQRIGRIDRIGQPAEMVKVRNYYYEGSVEAEIYRVLRDRLELFSVAVGPLQPVLGRVPKRIERAAMAIGEERARRLQEESRAVEEDYHTACAQMPNVDTLTRADPPLPPGGTPPCHPSQLQELLTTSLLLQKHCRWQELTPNLWRLEPAGGTSALPTAVPACFRQQVLEAQPEGVQHCLTWGDALFERLLTLVPAPATNQWGPLRRERTEAGEVWYRWEGPQGSEPILSYERLQELLAQLTSDPQ